MNEQRTDIFISYSHSDQIWSERLQTHLKPLARDFKIQVWSDVKGRADSKWREQIGRALNKARVVILLVSPHFLASEFMLASDLPRQLQATAKTGVVIVSVLISSSTFALAKEITLYFDFTAKPAAAKAVGKR